MNDDGLDGIVVAKLLDLLDHRAGIENDAFQFDYANLVPKTGAQRGVISARMKREVNQREHSQHKEEEGSSSDEYPEQSARTSVFSHTDGLV